MSRVTEEEIKRINELYIVYKNYSRVAKEVGRAPSTIKRHIDPNYIAEEKELLSIDWEKLESAAPIDLTQNATDQLTCLQPYDSSIKAFYLDETPFLKDLFIIRNNFNKIPIPQLISSYIILEARLIGMDYEEYVTFCEKNLGANIVRSELSKYVTIYFKKTEDVKNFILVLNKNFERSYKNFTLYK